MKDYTDEQILKMYENLPEDLKEAIFSVEMTKVIEEIGGKYKLQINKTGELGNETGMVMLGLTHPKEYISNLAKRLNVDMATSRKIGEEINSQIFSKIRDSLKKLHGIYEQEETPSVSSPTLDVKETGKEEVLKEIEKEEAVPSPPSPFEAKIKPEIFRAAPEESKYEEPATEPEKPKSAYSKGQDPYREPVDS